jgi:drug/metabolite transporter (DMT)-like permease/tetratricopeptide (TPR) repeat protein
MGALWRGERREFLPLTAAACASILAGSALVATRLVGKQVDPASLALHRYLIAVLLLSPLLVRRPRPPLKDLLSIAGLGVIFFGCLPLALTAGLHRTSASHAAIWVALSPAFTLLGASVLKLERLNVRKALGIVFSLSAVVCMQRSGSGGPPDLLASGALFTVALCTALYNVLSPPFTRKYSARVVVGYGSLAGAFFLLMAVAFEGRLDSFTRYDRYGLWGVLYLGAGCSALAMTLWAWSLSRTTPSRVAVFLNLNPLTASLLGGLVLGENLRWSMLGALPLALVGITLVTWSRRGGERSSAFVFDLWVLRGLAWLERLDVRRGSRAPTRAALQLVVGTLAAGRYRLDALLGEGGMGKVWLALDTLEGRQVAFKEMRAGNANAPEAAEAVAFKREFYTMTKLQHPNTVKVFDYGVLPSGDRFLTMDVVRGTDLRQLLDRGPVPLEKLYRILTEMAQVLGFIHSRLYVHCDIKSDNIRLNDRGQVKLMDFGLMHQLGTPSNGVLKGTPAYMAPEVAKGGVIDQRTDLYSLGVLAFELATGHYPFTGRTLTELLSAHLEHPVPHLATFRDVPPALDQLVQKLMAKAPSDRFRDAGALLAALAPLSNVPPEETSYEARTSYLHCADLIGRTEEQARLRHHLAEVQMGRGVSLFVSAPAGVGKTRLLQEFRLSVKLADVSFLVGQCRIEGQAPLEPLVEALTQVLPLTSPKTLARFGPLLARILPAVRALGIAEAAPTDPVTDKVQLLEALKGWLGEVSEEHSFLICLEDLHWADAATLEFTNVLIRSLVGRRAMVLGTFRSNEVDRLSTLFQTVDEQLTQQLELPLLSPDATDQLTRAMLGQVGGHETLVARLYAATAGNAFFITETIRAWIEAGVLLLEHGTWRSQTRFEELQLPSSIEEVVSQRVGHLEAPTLGFCRRASPLGRQMRLRELQEVSGLPDPELFAMLDELVERQFIQKVEDSFFFSHDTVRRAVYESMSGEERVAAHLQVALALERVHGDGAEREAALLGYHFALGHERPKAISYLLRAARLSRRTNLMLKATEQWAQAAELIEDGEYPQKMRTLIELWAQLIEVGMTAHPPTCVKYADKLFAVWDQQLNLSEAVRQFHREDERLRRGPRFFTRRKLVRIWSEQPLKAESQDPLRIIPKAFIYRSMEGIALSSLGQDARVLSLSDQMAADNPKPGPYRAAAYVSKAIYLLHTGQFEELARGARDALSWYQDHLRTVGTLPRMLWKDYTMSHHFLTVEQAMTGVAIDEEVWKRGMDLAQQHRFGDVVWFLQASRGVVASLAGDPTAMQTAYDRLVDGLRKMGNPMMAESRLVIWVSMYWFQRLEQEQAEAVCRKLDAWRLKLPHDRWMERYALAHRALYQALFGVAGEAQVAIDAAFAAVQDVPSFRLGAQLWAARSRTSLRLGDRNGAVNSAERALAQAEGSATRCTWDAWTARRALAEAVGGQPGMDRAEQLVSDTRAAQNPFHEALALFTLAQVAADTDRARAAQALQRSQEQLETLRCTAWLKELELFRQRAGAAASRRPALTTLGEASG